MPDDSPLTKEQKKVSDALIARYKALNKAGEALGKETQVWCGEQIKAANLPDPESYFVCLEHAHIVRRADLQQMLEEVLGEALGGQVTPIDGPYSDDSSPKEKLH